MTLDLPTTHRVPWAWIQAHASPPIRYRTARDILPPEGREPGLIDALRAEALAYKPALAIVKKQSAQGVWGANLLGLQALKAERLKDVGTIAQYRRLLELGWGSDDRPLRLTERLLFRLLSRDEDPSLLFEHRPAGLKDAEFALRVREIGREATACALAEAGYGDDPRVRGAAQRAATAVSQFLRSEFAEKPIVRLKSRNVLHPEAYAPTTFLVSLIAHMPGLQRERGGLMIKLASYLAQPAPKRQFVLSAGGRTLNARFTLLGDPIQADASGNTRDIPLALYWIEVLARLGVLDSSPTAQRVLARLLRDVDEGGVWRPRAIRAIPKATSRLSVHCFPLEAAAARGEVRFADVTFRLALIARLAGWTLEIT